MRILTLDDMDTRHYAFRRWFAGFDLVETYTAKEAINELKKGNVFDLVMLDHDLAYEHYEDQDISLDFDGEMGTGMEVARFISTMSEEQRPKRVVVHSWNRGAAWRMGQVLTEAGIWNRVKEFRPDDPVIIK